ncbi:nitrilase-related carbon-nitrogen hydrolase [Amycolatopsis sp. NBC_01480]|uniref:nitrilase-related carbon-nitrogen hydrolase n=1 Tax=Amycolatopsis sp. NBC_01480 TaxID=2903562 RepID=UPI002E2B090E|nr:nitrilase-related carbon-nitrogen hydrolase [Amycolatopsis sp. NBC_01480]
MFLLRFTRTSRRLAGLVLVWLVSVGAAVFWMWQMAVPLAGLTVLGGLAFGTVLALPYVADRLLVPRLGTAGEVLLFPMALAACEFLLGTFSPFGTAYGLLATTQDGNLALLQVISVVGPYGIGFLIGAFATVANWAWAHPPARRTARTVGAYALVVAVVAVAGGARLAWFPVDTAQTVRVAGINPGMALLGIEMTALGEPRVDAATVGRLGQAAIPRFDPDTVRAESTAVIDGLFADTRSAARAGAKIVVWSENAARISAAGEATFVARAQDVARQEHIWLDVADNVHLPDPSRDRDETHLIGPDGNLLWTYQKAHPVPGLESYTPGDGAVPVVNTPYGRVANVICYDADFPAMMHVDADIMLVPGGDWPEMGRVHTEMSGLRAVENGYSLVRQDFDGGSEAFDHNGHSLSIQDTTVERSLWLTDVPTRSTTTAYRVIGDVFSWLCLAGTIFFIGVGISRPRRRESESPQAHRARAGVGGTLSGGGG